MRYISAMNVCSNIHVGMYLLVIEYYCCIRDQFTYIHVRMYIRGLVKKVTCSLCYVVEREEEDSSLQRAV